MSRPPERTAGLVFFLAAALSAGAALYPLARGRGVNGGFGLLALVWLVIGLAQLSRARRRDRDGAG